MQDFELTKTRIAIERVEEWEKFTSLPRIALPADIAMQMMPATVGAMARIVLWKGDQRLSIYFDTLDRLGFVGQPYYELYPNLDGDTSRYLVGEEDQMAAEIARIFAPLQIEDQSNG